MKCLSGVTILIGILAVIFTSMKTMEKVEKELHDEIEKITTWSVMMILWPSIWSHIATSDFCENCSKVGLFWPYFIMIMDIALYNKSFSNISIEPTTVAGITFGIASFVGAVNDPIKMRFFTYPILINLLFLLPTFNVQRGDLKTVIETIQKICIVFSCALIVTGMTYKQPKFNFSY